MLWTWKNIEKNQTNDSRTQRVLGLRFIPTIFAAGILLVLLTPLFGAGPFHNANSQTSGGGSVTVPAGTRIMVRMTDAVDSEKSQPNERFRGALETNLMAGDTVVAPMGTTVFGRLITAQSASRGAGAELEFDLTDIKIDDQMHSLATSSHQVQGAAPSGKTATGAKTGAAIGAMAGGFSGLIRAGAAGAVAGKVSQGILHGERVNVPAGALVEFTLDHPVTLPATSK